MSRIRVGCRHSLVSSGKTNLNIAIAKFGVSTVTYDAFDTQVDEKIGEEQNINITCPYCNNEIDVLFKIDSKSKTRRRYRKNFLIILSIIYIPILYKLSTIPINRINDVYAVIVVATVALFIIGFILLVFYKMMMYNVNKGKNDIYFDRLFIKIGNALYTGKTEDHLIEGYID